VYDRWGQSPNISGKITKLKHKVYSIFHPDHASPLHMFCLPRPRPRVGRQRSRWRVLLRPPGFASALPPVPTLDPQRRHCPWHLWFPPARPPPRPLRRLPPRSGRVPKDLNESARISERRGHFKAINTKYLSEPNLRPETDHPPPTGSEALQAPPDTGQRPLSLSASTALWSHNMPRTGSKKPDRLRALESGFLAATGRW
jgi:hypothetical protein